MVPSKSDDKREAAENQKLGKSQRRQEKLRNGPPFPGTQILGTISGKQCPAQPVEEIPGNKTKHKKGKAEGKEETPESTDRKCSSGTKGLFSKQPALQRRPNGAYKNKAQVVWSNTPYDALASVRTAYGQHTAPTSSDLNSVRNTLKFVRVGPVVSQQIKGARCELKIKHG